MAASDTAATAGTPGSTTHRFTAPAVRDVAVAVGRYDVLNRDVGGVRLHLATPQTGTKADPQDWADEIDAAITSLTKVFGPFPYPEFWIAITPGQSDGTEFPAALQFGDVKGSRLRALVAQEVSHQWFYSLVGNNQAEDPWLDESLATFGESIVGGDGDDYQYSDISRRVVGLMGRPMTYWADNGGFDRYTEGVYNQGAAVLLHARRQIGADRFDTALRSYIVTNAHQIATPADFAHAFAKAPQVLDLLGKVGALPNSR
ncbi:MAG: M1 family aminopeptidase [Pseudonocardiaceae bacterium]